MFFASTAARDRAIDGLRARFPGVTVTSVDVPDENWAARSQASLCAVRVGRIVIAPPWDVPDPHGDLVILIQPSMGFGTGHHASTRLCLAALQRLDVAGRTVIDAGTGSGVLAIAACLLGASRVVGLDDDADAIASARENVELNGASGVTLRNDDLRSTSIAAADIVLANLTGGLLTAASRHLHDLAAHGGRLVLSGFMHTEEPDVVAAFSPWVVADRLEEDEWLCVILTHLIDGAAS